MPSKKPTAVKNAVIALTVQGNSKTSISNELGITQNTVRRILKESEIEDILGQGRSALYEMIPEAVDRYAKKVKSDPMEAKDFLERVTVLPAKQEQGTRINATQINFGALPIPNAGPRITNQADRQTT